MGHRGVFSFTLAVMLAGGGFSVARADGVVIPAAGGSVTCVQNQAGVPKIVSNATSCSIDSGLVEGARTLSPKPKVWGVANNVGGDAHFHGDLVYSLLVIGGLPGAVVPLKVDFNLSAIPLGTGGAYAGFFIETFGFDARSFDICSYLYNEGIGCGANTGEKSLDASIVVDAYSGFINTNAVILTADVQAYDPFGVVGGYASADPYIYVDPSFPNAGDYTVVLSPGVGNSPPGVPEPATWAMMILGVAAIGSAARRRGRVIRLAGAGPDRVIEVGRFR